MVVSANISSFIFFVCFIVIVISRSPIAILISIAVSLEWFPSLRILSDFALIWYEAAYGVEESIFGNQWLLTTSQKMDTRGAPSSFVPENSEIHISQTRRHRVQSCSHHSAYSPRAIPKTFQLEIREIDSHSVLMAETV